MFDHLDFAAELRAPTPTAAAELAVPVRAELSVRVIDLGGRMIGAMARNQEVRRQGLRSLARGLPSDPRRLLEGAAQRLDTASERMLAALRLWVERQRARIPAPRPGPLRSGIVHRRAALGVLSPRLLSALRRGLDQAAERLAAQARLLDGFGFAQVLARGFVLLRDGHGAPVVSAAVAKPGMAVELTFHDGARGATIDGRPDRIKPTAPPTDQGDLF
ncbi:MAG: hypothetical protein IIC08_03895 [Proteobacteria bacterium]|nr:hypothetical protein [Pseudomonadota bacterium]